MILCEKGLESRSKGDLIFFKNKLSRAYGRKMSHFRPFFIKYYTAPPLFFILKTTCPVCPATAEATTGVDKLLIWVYDVIELKEAL